MSDESKRNSSRKALKVLGILAICVLAVIAVAFGLLVGLCSLKR